MPKDDGAGTGTGTKTDEVVDDFEDEQELDDEGNPIEKKKTEDEEFDKDRALATIARQRESEKKLKKDLQDAKATLKEIQDKDLPEKDRATQAAKDAEGRADAAEKRVQGLTVRTFALEAAATLGFKNPALAARLIDAEDIEWDDDEPTNLKALLKDILKENPELKGRAKRTNPDDEDDEDDDETGADAGAGRKRKASGFDMNREIRRASGRRG